MSSSSVSCAVATCRSRNELPEKILERLNDASGVWFEGTLLERRQTPFQLLEVYETPELGRIFRLDGFNMTSERDEFFYHENLVHPAAVAHPAPRRALVIGGGDGGSSEELLKHSTLEVVHMAELDPVVIEVAKAQFQKVHRGVFDNPRLKVTVGDGLAYLRTTEARYDAQRRAHAAHRLALLAPEARARDDRQPEERVPQGDAVLRAHPAVRLHLGLRVRLRRARAQGARARGGRARDRRARREGPA